jgi:hypothetical protein
MYMSQLHGGHGGGKTSSLKHIGCREVTAKLVAGVESRPFPLCYLHLLHGGGAISDIPEEATAFGCRGWDFACVITGVWPRDQDGTSLARSVMQWVYDVASDLLLVGVGAYGADLGPDPRDGVMAAHAFGPNGPKLARLKVAMDPSNVLIHACPVNIADE